MSINIDINDILDAKIEVYDSSDTLIKTLDPIITKQDLRAISELYRSNNSIQDVETLISSRLSKTFLQLVSSEDNEVNNNYLLVRSTGGKTIRFNYPDRNSLRKAIQDEIQKLLDKAKSEGIINNMSSKISNRNRLSHDISRLSTEIEFATSRVNFNFSLDDTTSLQIGYVLFGKDELGPDCITIGDLNEVTSMGSIRSETEIAIKGPNGRTMIEIDIIFPTTDSINNKFRQLLGMLRMSPVIPIGGSLLSATLINKITASEVYNDLVDQLTSSAIKNSNISSEFDRITSIMDGQAKIQLDQMITALGNESQGLDIIKRQLEYEVRQKQRQQDNKVTGIATPDPSQLLVDRNIKSFLVPVILESIVVSTIAAAPGAIRVRLSFNRYYDAYMPTGGLSFIDSNGDPTFNILKCTPLINSVNKIFLNPKRASPRANGKFTYTEGEWNKYYIPKIGDDLKVSYGIGLAGVASSLVRKSEFGHNLYVDPKLVSGGKESASPILIRFATQVQSNIVYEYIPTDLIVESIVWTQQNKIATIPMEGVVYPTYQITGRSIVSAVITFQTTDREALRKIMTIKNSMDSLSHYSSGSALLRREFCDIYNDILNLSAYKRFIVSGIEVKNNPDFVELYSITVNLISNEETVEEAEKLEVRESLNATSTEVTTFWWWLYAGLFLKYYSHNSGQPNFNNDFSNSVKSLTSLTIDPQTFGDISVSGPNASHTAEELNTIWDFVFGKDDGGKYVEGVMENNLFIAAFLDMMFSGQIAGRLANDLDVPTAYSGGNFDKRPDLSTFLPEALRASRDTIESGRNSAYYLGNENLTEIEDIMSIVIETLNANTQTNGTPWWYLDQGYSFNKSKDMLLAIRKRLDSGPSAGLDNPVITNLIIPNSKESLLWLPTPAMWQAMLNVILNIERYGTKRQNETWRGNDLSYFLNSDFTPEAAFALTNKLRTMKSVLNGIISDIRFQGLFPSFWKRLKNRPQDTISRISSLGNTQDELKDWNIDYRVFEYRNNYKDIPLPRYVEIFAESETSESPRPKIQNGIEVWRKVAPSFLELGQPPELYASISGLMVSPDKIGFTNPGLLTPRGFFDYCEPGFFYYKKTWIVDKYREILDDIKNETEPGGPGSLSPLGPGGESSPFLPSEQERETLQRIYLQNPDQTITIAGADYGIKGLVDKKTAAQSQGVITTNPNFKTDLGPFGDFIAKKVQRDFNKTLTRDEDIEKLRLLKQGKIKRISILDGSGRNVGILLAPTKGVKGPKTISVSVGKSVVDARIIDLNKAPLNPSNNRDSKVTDSYYYFVDSFASMPRKPGDIKYEDAAGVLSYNKYKPEHAKMVYLKTLEHIGDMKLNHVRAYPTFRLYFVRESFTDKDSITQYLEDDMYGYSSIINLDIIIDKEDAATAIIDVTDISGNLSNAVYEQDVFRQPNIGTNGAIQTEEERDKLNKTPYKIKLEVGANIIIKMGYGQDPDSLQTVFTGAIAEIAPGDVTRIVAQSYRTELLRYVNYYSSTGLISGLIDTYLLKRVVTPVAGLFLIHKVLTSLASVPGIDTATTYNGIPHFGRFISLARFKGLSPAEQKEIKDGWSTQADSKLNDVSKILDLGVNLGVAGLVLSVAPQGRDLFANFMAKYNENNLHTNAMRNVFWSDDPVTDGYLDKLGDEWLIEGNGWSALKEITRYKVGYVCQELPYGTRSTIFIGKPDALYHYKPVSQELLSRHAQSMPTIYNGLYSVLFNEIIGKFLASDEYGSILPIVQLHAWLLDRNLGQTNTSLGSFIGYVEDKYRRATFHSNSSSPLSVNPIDVEPFLGDPGLLPSYKAASYLINSLKRVLKIGIGTGPSLDQKKIIKKISLPGSLRDDKSNGDIIPLPFEGDGSTSYVVIDPSLRVTQEVLNNIVGSSGILIKNRTNGFELVSSDIDMLSPGLLPEIGRRLTPNEIRDAGYIANDIIALTSEGTLLDRASLERLGIDPQTGLPTVPLSDNTGIPSNGNITPGSILIATNGGFTSLSRNAYQDHFNVNGVFARVGPTEGQLSSISPSIILTADNSSYYKDIVSFNDQFVKLIFSIFYGIGYRKTGSGNEMKVEFLNFPEGLDSIWQPFTATLMRGIASISDPESSFASNDSYDQQIKKLSDNLNSIVINGLDRSLTQIKYGDVRSTSVTLDQNDVQAAIAIFDSQLKDMVSSGQIVPADIAIYQSKVRQFLSLAQVGGLSANLVRDVGASSGDILNSIRRYVFGNNQPITGLVDGISSIDRFTSSLMSGDQKLTNALAGLPNGIIFDPNNQNHINTFRTNVANIVAIYNRNASPFSRSVEVQRYLRSLGLSESEASSYYSLIDNNSFGTQSTLNTTQLESTILSDIVTEDIQNPKPIISASDNENLSTVILRYMDDYKLILIFFSKWLKKNANTVDGLRSIQTANSVLSLLSEFSPPGVKRFRDTHHVSSGTDIVENRLIVTMSHMANNILMFTSRDVTVKNSNPDNADVPIYTTDEENTEWIPYPNYQTFGVDFNPYVSPELRKQRKVKERNAETNGQRAACLINHMAEALRPMYRGYIKILGKVVKPYDVVILSDQYNDMFGPIEVERVVHNFNSENGWTTTITPCALVNPLDEAAAVAKRFDTTLIDYVYRGLDIIDRTMDILFLYQLLLKPAFVGFGSAIKAGVGEVAAGAGTAALSDSTALAGKGFKGALARGLTNILLSPSNKAFVKQAEEIVAKKFTDISTAEARAEVAKVARELWVQAHPGWANLGTKIYGAISEIAKVNTYGKAAEAYMISLFGRKGLRLGSSMLFNLATDWMLESTTLPVHVYCVTRFGKPLQAGLDAEYQKFFSWQERLGAFIDGAYTNIIKTIADAATIYERDVTSDQTILRIFK